MPAALRDAGVPNVLAPVRTRASTLWAELGDRSLVLYPFVPGRNAMDAGMTERQWRTFGATLRAVHDSGLERRFEGILPTDGFSSAAPASVERDVEPHETAWFFSGYGDFAVDPEALIYYRYERILEDIGEFAASVLLDDTQTDATRDGQTDLVASFFRPGGILETVEQV